MCLVLDAQLGLVSGIIASLVPLSDSKTRPHCLVDFLRSIEPKMALTVNVTPTIDGVLCLLSLPPPSTTGQNRKKPPPGAATEKRAPMEMKTNRPINLQPHLNPRYDPFGG